ncbi:Eukaryotic aspartyl protease [Aphelenchoides besseyi]|nr:Eukaryotic aspartyl protease [Aphelenchoides besseyi]KAI6193118.1 Eukaryotic aspartyl protease [Aphelenchoides besseyi]
MESLKVAIWFALIGISLQTITVPLTNYHDVIYRGKVSVGTPQQEFDAVYHTGCTLTRFPAKGCQASGRFADACKPGKTYNPAASRSSRYYSFFKVVAVEYTHFGSSGREYYDTLAFKDGKTGNELAVRNAFVGASNRVWGFDHAVVCLASSAKRESNSTFVQMHNNRVLPKTLMTVALRKCDREHCEDGGAVTFGGYDRKNCRSFVQWMPLIEGSSAWRFRLDYLKINNHPVAQARRAIANTDTGNSYIHFPKSWIPSVIALLKVKKHGFYYTTDCKAKFSLVFVIGNRKFTVDQRDLILNQQINGECVVAITENINDPRTLILGAAFHRAVCVIHDIDGRRLGFSLSAHH